VTIVVDASVAIKWVLDEEDSQATRQLLDDQILIAPDFIILECANILWAAVAPQPIDRRTRDCGVGGNPSCARSALSDC
jgi:predicted nucleic acid-binding protein